MSRHYEMNLDVTNYKIRRLKQIVRACRNEWSFAPDDFDREWADPLAKCGHRLVANAQGDLCGGETEHEFTERLAQAIWKANGGYCLVEVRATCLEDLPYDRHTYDETDYQLLRAAKRRKK